MVFGDTIQRGLFDLDIPDLDKTVHDAATTRPPDGGESGGQP
jgi:hypothetical protein